MGRSLALAFLLVLTGCSSILMQDGGTTPLLSSRPVEDLVFYEANFQTLSGNSKIQALTGRLDEIEALSVNTLWLMPLYPIGQLKSVHSPYSVKDYKAVNPELGTMADLRALVAAAHARGIAVVLDWVANHTAWDNAWMSHPSWYTRDSSGNILSPTGFNWTDVADLNYSSQEMRAAMIDAMASWVTDVGIDGFRCDAADYVPDDFWSRAISEVDTKAGKHLIWLAEGGRKSLYSCGFDLLYGWDGSSGLAEVFQGSRTPTSWFSVLKSETSGLAAGKDRLRYTTNHDLAAWESSAVTRFGSLEASVAAFAVSSLVGGPPLVYGSQEIGFPGTVSFFDAQPLDWASHPEIQQEYRDILAFRASEAVRHGELVNQSTQTFIAFKRDINGHGVFVAANTGDSAGSINGPTGAVTVAAHGYTVISY